MTETTEHKLKHVEPDKFSVKVFAHDMPNGPATVTCWTYVTDGFEALGQKEFVFTLRRQINEDPMNPPWDIVSILNGIFSLAEEGKFVHAGGMSYFQNEESGLFGFTDLIGFAYVLPQELSGVELKDPNRYLLAMLLVPGEPEFSEKWGAYRVLARLGRNAFYFPYPPWSDRNRNSMITKEDWETSLLANTPSIHLMSSFLVFPVKPVLASTEPGQIKRLETPRGTATLYIHSDNESDFGRVLEYMGPACDQVVAIILKPAEESIAQLTWNPADKGTCITGLAGAGAGSITGGFMSLAVSPQINHSGCFLEDGFFFSMTTSAWSKIHRRLAMGKSVSIAAAGPGEFGLSIKFLSNSDKPWWMFW